ncbi:MAG: HD domain-containing phosphohydrolase, partial [Candidatus Omnitrophota bacterium]
GYPDGLKGEEIPIIAAIISAADAFDAMTSDRPYRKALTTTEAIEEIKLGKGKQFHPEVADALISLYQKGQL